MKQAWMTATILVFGLVACSSPNELVDTNLTPQFGSGDDDIGIDVATVSTGRIYTLFTQNGSIYEEDSSGESEEVRDYQQIWLRRTDATGKTTWTKQVAYTSCNENYPEECTYIAPKSVTSDSSGYVYTLYSTNYEAYGDLNVDVTPFHVVKFDASGRFVRSTQIATHIFGPYGEEDYFEISAEVAVDNSGNIYFAGTDCESVEDESTTVSGDCAYVVTKRSSTGVLQWQRTSSIGAASDIVVSSNGSLYVSGANGLARYSTNGNLIWTKSIGPLDNVVVSSSNIYVRRYKDIRKFDANGKQLWLKSQTGLNTIIGQDISGDGSGNVYLSGKYNAGSGNYSPFVRKLNSSGTVLWTKTYGTPAYDDARGIATITGSEIYVTGETQGSLSHTNIGGRDGYLRKLNSSGNLVWSK